MLNDELKQKIINNQVFYKDIDESLKNLLVQTINDLTINYGFKINPFISGKYVIYMINGPWYNIFLNNNFEGEDFISNKKFFISYELNNNPLFNKFLNNNVLKTDKEYTTNEFFSNNYRSENATKNFFTLLATDIDVPEPTKEYINISSRSQTLTHYQRETILPDFSISFIEDNSLFIIRYLEAWHKMIELYRRGKIPVSTKDLISENSPYFYKIPYCNSFFILIFDIQYEVRGIIYLVGVKPVSLPIKQVIGNRSSSKMTVYNVSYKLTNMYYKFFSNTKEFSQYLNDKDNKLALIFKKNIINN
jgi:hypothetical protein